MPAEHVIPFPGWSWHLVFWGAKPAWVVFDRIAYELSHEA